MSLRNQVMLITYADSFGENLKELSRILERHFVGTIGGVHILPFYPPTADCALLRPATTRSILHSVVGPIFAESRIALISWPTS